MVPVPHAPRPGQRSGARLCRPVSGAGRFALAVLATLLTGVPLSAETPGATPAVPPEVQALRDEMAALRRDYEARLAALEARLAAWEATGAPAADTVPDAQAPAPQPPVAAGTASGNSFNPAIAVIGNFIGTAGDNVVEESPSLTLRESELSLSAAIDPYARADFFIGFSEEEVAVEEGYVTFTALPGQLLAKVGRQRVPFGKVNTLHPHSLSWVDVPLPMRNLVGGEEGWKDDGLTVARLIPLGDTFSELAVSVLRGRSEGLFDSEERSDLAGNVHFRLFRDLSDSTNLDLGLSWAQGPNGTATGMDTTLAGIDATWRWKPLSAARYRSLLLRGEAVWSEREQPEGAERAMGWYLAGDLQVSRRWTLGARLEQAERAEDAGLRDDGAALLLTFRPSEFQLLRGELRRRRYAEGVTADELFLQLQFLIGAHGAHPF